MREAVLEQVVLIPNQISRCISRNVKWDPGETNGTQQDMTCSSVVFAPCSVRTNLRYILCQRCPPRACHVGRQ